MPLPDRFTAHLQHVLQRASVFAAQAKATAVAPPHLLLALALERGCIGSEILAKTRVKPEAIAVAVGIVSVAPPAITPSPTSPPGLRGASNSPSVPRSLSGPSGGGEPGDAPAAPVAAITALTDTAKRALEKAALAASAHEHRYIGTEHLLAGLLEIEDTKLTAIFAEHQMDPASVSQHLLNVLKSTSRFPDFTSAIADPQELMAQAEVQKATEAEQQKTPALDFFAKDLTNPDIVAKIDPVVGRDKEIERVVQILCRRTKNNPILVGEPGVGKTAIVEGLARRITERDVPDILVGKRILALDLALVVAGTIYRGEFESRLKQILDEVRQDRDLVLFIDEIHTIMGAGAASGSLDAANILKPALARGDIRCIGATTYDEFKKHVENDAALERRFQQVHVAEPSKEQTVEILRGLKPYYEQFHHVGITERAIESAVQLADRYLSDRQFPDKAIDLIDEASARLRVHAKNDPLIRRSSAITARLEKIEEDKRAAVITDRFDDATAIQREHAKITKELASIHEQLKEQRVEQVGHITDRDVAAVIAQTIGLPVEEILLEEHERFLRLGAALRERIIGQEEAVTAIAAALQRAKSGLASPDRPLASFLLLGPTGVGKTETAKALADMLFQRKDALIRLDMSEFSEGFTVSKLIGAPAGYVGYREGSKLTDEIRKRPASVVLFDEIEKAHPDVWNLLLQILEDGRLTDATGRESRFTNSIIIMTSNVGAEAFTKAGIGFLDGISSGDTLARAYDEIRLDALQALRGKFRPELLNRIDETVVYRPLDRDTLGAIARHAMTAFATRLAAEQHITLRIRDDVAAWLAARAFDPAQGARAIRRLLHTHVENPVAAGILEERFCKGDTVDVAIAGDEKALALTKHVGVRPRVRKERVKM